ncbi:MAG: hypothetical protein H2B06_07355 [Nitrosopumilaceae archaeon]|nr:hypothetical protein [Nitrosopumilaceae archaeon]
MKIILFVLLIGSTGTVSSAVFAEPQMTAVIEKTTYTYCEKLAYTIEVSEITGDLAIIHIRDETDKKSSAIPIPIEKLSNPIPSAYPFQKDIFPSGKYFIDIEYSGATTTLEFDLIDSDNLCISQAMKPVIIRWVNEEFTDGMLMSGFQNLVDNKLLDIPYQITEKNIDKIKIPQWVKSIGNGWIMGIISDQMFAKNLQYLIDQKIISNGDNRINEQG